LAHASNKERELLLHNQGSAISVLRQTLVTIARKTPEATTKLPVPILTLGSSDEISAKKSGR